MVKSKYVSLDEHITHLEYMLKIAEVEERYEDCIIYRDAIIGLKLQKQM